MKIVIAIPALNEAAIIGQTVAKVRHFAVSRMAEHQVTVVVADNGSTDRTATIVGAIAAIDEEVHLVQLAERGKGRAIRAAWQAYDADIYVFIDADLAVSLDALPALVIAVQEGAGLAVGSRYHHASRVTRSPWRRMFSAGYRMLLAGVLETDVADMPCGFKAVSAAVAAEILPQVSDHRWFFDTELVVRAERSGHRITEVPVEWREVTAGPKRISKVRVFGLAREYFWRVAALRRTLGPRHYDDGRPSVRSVLGSISRGERRRVLMVAALVAVIGLLPPVVGTLWAGYNGWEWNGRTVLAPGDAAIYLSYIAQARAGHLLFVNAATTESLVPVFNIVWLLVGWLARLLWLTPLAAYHLARTLLIFPFALVAYAAIAAFVRERVARTASFLLLMFGSGVGLYAAPLLGSPVMVGARYDWPTDFWVAESNAFMSMLYSPHFVASFALLIAVAVLLYLAYASERPQYGAWAGLVGLVLFQFHPFHAITLWAVAAVALVALTYAEGFNMRRWAAGVACVLISAPSVAYHYWLTHLTANARFMLENNVTPTPMPLHLLLGLGAIIPLAMYGWVLERRSAQPLLPQRARQFLVVWAVTQTLLLYAPFVFQRRLIEGLQFPLTLLAIPAVLHIGRKVLTHRFGIAFAAMACATIFLPSSFGTIDRLVQAAHGTPETPFMFGAGENGALTWLRTNAPESAVVLTDANLGNDAIGWGERRSYVGHWANTIDAGRKQLEVRDFFGSMNDAERRQFVLRSGIKYVLVGPAEQSYRERIAQSAWLWHRFGNGGYDIYEVMIAE